MGKFSKERAVLRKSIQRLQTIIQQLVAFFLMTGKMVRFVANYQSMGNITNRQKRDLARVLFCKENLTMQEVAEKVGVSRQTVSKWARDDKWEEQKAGVTLTKEEQIKNLYRQVAELNRSILEREEGARYATIAEADTISKLSAAIRKMESETGIADIISVGIKFIEWIRKADIDRAKEMAEVWDLFVKDQL